MIKFTFTAVDQREPHEKKFDSIEDYESGWGPVNHDMLHRYHVTNDGINTIRCDDPQSRLQLEAHFEEQAFKKKFDDSYYQMSMMLNLLNIDVDDAYKLYKAQISGQVEPLVHEVGNVFVLDPINNPADKELLNKICPNQSVLKEVTQPTGSYYLKDTLVVEDGYNNNVLVVDTRGEAKSIKDLLPRSIEKGEVMIDDRSDEDHECYNQISGNQDLVKQYIEKTNEEFKNTNWECQTGGFNNSESNPTHRLLSTHLFKQGDEQYFIPKAGTIHDSKIFVKVTPAMCLAAGAKENDIYLEGDEKGQVHHFQKGQFIDTNDMSVYSARDIALDYRSPTAKEQDNSFPF